MLRIRNLSLPVDGTVDDLKQAAAHTLGVKPGALERFAIARQSIDARKKQDVRCIYTVDVSLPDEGRILLRPGKIEAWEPLPYRFPLKKRTSSLPPVVVGMGPAGLFAALYLARNGLPCIVLERGQDVDTRTRDVERTPHFLPGREAFHVLKGGSRQTPPGVLA